MKQPELDKIKQTAQEFFEQAGLEVEVQVNNPQEATVPIILTTQDPQILIGERGQTLNEIQKLLRSIIKKRIETPDHFYVDIDVNDYKKKKTEYLSETARTAADEVALMGEEKELQPMTAYERRIIHLELTDRSDIVTESIGQEPERRVVIKPA